MRNFQKKLTAAAVTATLLSLIGVAVAQTSNSASPAATSSNNATPRTDPVGRGIDSGPGSSAGRMQNPDSSVSPRSGNASHRDAGPGNSSPVKTMPKPRADRN